MNNDSPFSAIGDEPVEARIVAWVLGEASAFEGAELERLCEERPELLVFRRRMRALHALLLEAETEQPAAGAWKLPPEQRQNLDAILGSVTAPVRPDAQGDERKERRIGRSGRRAFLAIAACVVLSLVVLGLLGPGSIQKAKRMARAATESAAPADARMRLTTELPPELIEGTPRPIVLPGQPSAKKQTEMAAESRGRVFSKMDALTSLEKAGAASVRAPNPSDGSDESDESEESEMADAFDALAAGDLKRQAFQTRNAGAIREDRPMRLSNVGPRAVPPVIGSPRVFAEGATANLTLPEPADSFASLSGGCTGLAAPGAGGPGSGVGSGFGAAQPAPTPAPAPPSDPSVASASAAGLRSGDEAVPSAELESLFRRDGLESAERAQPLADAEAKKVVEELPAVGALFSAARAAGGKSPGDSDADTRDMAKHGQFGFVGAADHKAPSSQIETRSEGHRSGNEIIWEFTYPTEYEPPEVPGKPSPETTALQQAIKEQQDKVEDRRKALASIVRTKGIIYKGEAEAKDPRREDGIKRGLDAQDYLDAKREFERDQQILQQMRQKLLDATAAPAAEEPQAKPPKRPVEKTEETTAVEDPYSTFSLNISDASYQVAQAALAKGERPDPAGIKLEQFYNAVDYGDPAPIAGEPVAVTMEQAAHPVIPGRHLLRVALKTAAAGRAASQPLRLTLLVDQSGSMVRDDRRAAMDQALAGLAGLLTANDRVTVIGFARTPRLLADSWNAAQAAKLAELVNQSASEGGTNLEEAIRLAEKIASGRQLAGAQNRIVLFTDGAANLGDADPARLATHIKALRQKGLAFDIAGIAADGLNDGLLAELARNGNGRYYVVGKGGDDGNFARQLAGAFRPAAENVKVQVHFNPERVGRYRLLGFEKDRLATEDFRNDAVDAAELAAEEAGVAIYQVEPLAAGSGELGEVSVRFRDTASGRMVERSWTIPHAPNAPAIDRAAPSMQLAVMALFAAEKLRGGPLGEAIDFKQFAAVRANVRQVYGASGRNGQMLQLINKL